MTATPKGKELIDRYGYDFSCRYSVRKKISRDRMERLFSLYRFLSDVGEIDIRDISNGMIEQYEVRSRQTLLRDLHALEDMGIVSSILDFGKGERYDYKEVFETVTY